MWSSSRSVSCCFFYGTWLLKKGEMNDQVRTQDGVAALLLLIILLLISIFVLYPPVFHIYDLWRTLAWSIINKLFLKNKNAFLVKWCHFTGIYSELFPRFQLVSWILIFIWIWDGEFFFSWNVQRLIGTSLSLARWQCEIGVFHRVQVNVTTSTNSIVSCSWLATNASFFAN